MNVDKLVDTIRSKWAVRNDAEDKGRWVTTENGHHVHLNENGEPDIGNKHVLEAFEDGNRTEGKKKVETPENHKFNGLKSRNPKKVKKADYATNDEFLDAAGVPRITEEDAKSINEQVNKNLIVNNGDEGKRKETKKILTDALYAVRDGAVVELTYEDNKWFNKKSRWVKNEGYWWKENELKQALKEKERYGEAAIHTGSNLRVNPKKPNSKPLFAFMNHQMSDFMDLDYIWGIELKPLG